jgi:uncharacterized oxidoreductase
MPILDEKQLRKISIALFQAAGVSKEEAVLVTDHLVEANLVGLDSHGVMRLPSYIKNIKKAPSGKYNERHLKHI